MRMNTDVNNESIRLYSRSSGGTEYEVFQGSNIGAAQLFYQNNVRALTGSLGLTVRGNSVSNNIFTMQDSATTPLFRIEVNSGNARLVSDVDGSNVILEGQDSASALHQILVGDPSGDLDLYWDGTIGLSLVSTGVDLLAALVDQDNSGSAAASSYLIRNSEGGFRISVDGDNTTFTQTASNGGNEDLLFTFTNNAQTEFYFNGTVVAETQLWSTDYTTSGLTTKDHGGTPIDVGWNLMPAKEEDASFTLDEDDVSKMLHRDDTGAALFTLPSGTSGAVPPVGAMSMITNENGTGAHTIAAAGTLRWLEGSGTPSTGTRTLAEGGIATVYHYSDTEWWIWGIGLS